MIGKNLTVLFLTLVLFGCSKKEPNDFLRQPIVGIIQNSEVPILIKTIYKGKVRIEYKKADESSSTFTNWKMLSDSNALTTDLILSGLNYDTEYKYRVEFDEDSYSKWFNFKTFPTQGAPGKFNFVFSSCMREKYMSPYVFNDIAQISPTFVALLGDQMYGDYDGNLNKLELYRNNDSIRQAMVKKGEIILKDKTVLQAFRSKYQRAFIKSFQKMSSSIPFVATWDDHDYGQDNSDGTYRYKEIAKKVFKETYPTYPFEEKNGGLYYKYTIANVDVFVLDTRWYRSPMQNKDEKGKTMLGEKQLLWLLDGLKQSTAPFKIIFSSVSMNDYGGDTSSGRDGFDNWMGYTYERSKIYTFIDNNNIKGVLVFSGDQHYPSVHILNWKNPLKYVSKTDSSIEYSLDNLGNAVFDFSSSPLNYKISTGQPLIPANQKNPNFSYEIFRPEWAKPEKVKQNDDIVITSVYGIVEIDTKSSLPNVLVKFYEINPETSKKVELYSVKVTY